MSVLGQTGQYRRALGGPHVGRYQRATDHQIITHECAKDDDVGRPKLFQGGIIRFLREFVVADDFSPIPYYDRFFFAQAIQASLVADYI